LPSKPDGEREWFGLRKSENQQKAQRLAALLLPTSCALLIEGMVPPVHISYTSKF
jgi:hypothetical protein